MNKYIKILLLVLFSISIFSIGDMALAENIEKLGGITGGKTTTTFQTAGKDTADGVQHITWELLDIIRYIFSAVLVVFIIYAGIQMIMSMGTDDEELSKSKRTFWYAIIGIFFINFPVALYNLLFGEGKNKSDFFLNTDNFIKIIEYVIIFLEIIMIGVAIFMIVLTGIKLITSRGRDEKITEVKNKILWIVIALIFIGFIEVWRNFLIGGNNNNIEKGYFNMSEGVSIFSTLANLALYLAVPVALFFLTLAGYYYITSVGNDEKAKKGKTIIINTVIGVVILLCAYVFLNDINLLTI